MILLFVGGRVAQKQVLELDQMVMQNDGEACDASESRLAYDFWGAEPERGFFECPRITRRAAISRADPADFATTFTPRPSFTDFGSRQAERFPSGTAQNSPNVVEAPPQNQNLSALGQTAFARAAVQAHRKRAGGQLQPFDAGMVNHPRAIESISPRLNGRLQRWNGLHNRQRRN